MENILQVIKDMSQEKPITFRQATGSPTSSPQNDSIMQRLSDLFFTYVKYDGQRNFCAFDINEGRPVRNLIYATMVEDTIENRLKLQELANVNNDIDLTIQLRDRKGKIVFQTKQ